jgi:hypothetical protein
MTDIFLPDFPAGAFLFLLRRIEVKIRYCKFENSAAHTEFFSTSCTIFTLNEPIKGVQIIIFIMVLKGEC